MELKIVSPQEGGFVKEITWNNEELKAEIAEKMQEYKSLAFTEEMIKDAKEDRAKLNKLRIGIESERKRIKNLCLAPYEKFEAQVKEIVTIIDEPIMLIGRQIKEVEEQKKIRKRQKIEELFSGIGFQPFVPFDAIFDPKWLNASVPMSRIEEQMKNRMYQIGDEVATIQNLPEFSFEAMETYKKTLDLPMAIQEGKRLSDMQKRKAAYEEEQRRKAEEERLRKREEESRKAAAAQREERKPAAAPEQQEEKKDPELFQMDFRVWGTREQIMGLRQYLVKSKIKFGKVE